MTAVRVRTTRGPALVVVVLLALTACARPAPIEGFLHGYSGADPQGDATPAFLDILHFEVRNDRDSRSLTFIWTLAAEVPAPPAEGFYAWVGRLTGRVYQASAALMPDGWRVKVSLLEAVPFRTLSHPPRAILPDDYRVVAESVVDIAPVSGGRTLRLTVPDAQFPNLPRVASATPANAHTWSARGPCDAVAWVEVGPGHNQPKDCT